MERIIEKLSRFNQISVPLTESTKIQWYDADPFAIGISHLSAIVIEQPSGKPYLFDFNFYVIYGEFLHGSKNTVLGIIKKEEAHFMYSFSKNILLDGNKIWANISFEDVISFFDAIPNDLALCINIPWVKPFIDLACKNN
jgi:hypothetical protein